MIESIAHYRMIAKIGEGGMGEVYRALDTKLGREVAIKIIPETFARDADRMMRFAKPACWRRLIIPTSPQSTAWRSARS